jgi:hypothetical protein
MKQLIFFHPSFFSCFYLISLFERGFFLGPPLCDAKSMCVFRFSGYGHCVYY